MQGTGYLVICDGARFSFFDAYLVARDAVFFSVL